ncbi:MAG: response regulator receiver protein [Chitinophagaceae bacterium]|jgi:CheY-like chemotaxis protein|nr:response regulator receiver protein [Chitinophagaceae bacterium]
MEKLINILLVEDDQLDAIDIRRTLDKAKVFYHLEIAKNGEAALELLEQPGFKPDVALVDINMPKMNGLEFLSIIRQDERWKQLKCFIITTSDEKVDRETARALGVSGYIIKPLKLNNASSLDAFNLMIDLMNMK